jgi:hypothetical protein
MSTNAKFISLKTNPSIFQTRNTRTNTSTNTNFNSNATAVTYNASPALPWTWGSALLWATFAIGIVTVLGGFLYALTKRNTVPDKTDQEKSTNSLVIAMMVIGFVLCGLPFIISIFTNTRMF